MMTVKCVSFSIEFVFFHTFPSKFARILAFLLLSLTLPSASGGLLFRLLTCNYEIYISIFIDRYLRLYFLREFDCTLLQIASHSCNKIYAAIWVVAIASNNNNSATKERSRIFLFLLMLHTSWLSPSLSIAAHMGIDWMGKRYDIDRSIYFVLFLHFCCCGWMHVSNFMSKSWTYTHSPFKLANGTWVLCKLSILEKKLLVSCHVKCEVDCFSFAVLIRFSLLSPFTTISICPLISCTHDSLPLSLSLSLWLFQSVSCHRFWLLSASNVPPHTGDLTSNILQIKRMCVHTK